MVLKCCNRDESNFTNPCALTYVSEKQGDPGRFLKGAKKAAQTGGLVISVQRVILSTKAWRLLSHRQAAGYNTPPGKASAAGWSIGSILSAP